MNIFRNLSPGMQSFIMCCSLAVLAYMIRLIPTGNKKQRGPTLEEVFLSCLCLFFCWEAFASFARGYDFKTNMFESVVGTMCISIVCAAIAWTLSLVPKGLTWVVERKLPQ